MQEDTKAKDSSQYLTFILGSGTYAFEVTKTREVLTHFSLTKLPKAPPFIVGVTNLRGSVLPVVDLKNKLSMPEEGNAEAKPIIVTEVNYNGELVAIGTLVDSVRAVLRFSDDELVPPPRDGLGIESEFISAIARNGKEFILILNPDIVFAEKELVF